MTSSQGGNWHVASLPTFHSVPNTKWQICMPCTLLWTLLPSFLSLLLLFHSLDHPTLTPRSCFSPCAQLAASSSASPASVLSAVLWLSLHPLEAQWPASDPTLDFPLSLHLRSVFLLLLQHFCFSAHEAVMWSVWASLLIPTPRNVDCTSS